MKWKKPLGAFLLGMGLCGMGYYLNGWEGWMHGLFIGLGFILLNNTKDKKDDK